ncbi:MAG: hypothetical protein AAGF12_13910 [Myxococcota bacterium]
MKVDESSLRSLGSVDRIYLYTYEDLILQINRGEDTHRAADWVCDTVREYKQGRANAKLAHVVFLEPPRKPLPPEMRKKLREVMHELYPELELVVLVFDGVGFFAGMVISVAFGLMSGFGNSKIAKNVSEAAHQIHEALPGYGVEMIDTAIEAARRQARVDDGVGAVAS